VAAGVIALALAGGSEVAAPRPGAEPLPVAYENALTALAANLNRNAYRRADILRMACPIDRTLHDGGVAMDRTYRSYMRRVLQLLQDHADIDLATACSPR
jgi:hypothetical protein